MLKWNYTIKKMETLVIEMYQIGRLFLLILSIIDVK